MIPLSTALQDSIRFETNYQLYLPSLYQINKPRFRALGDMQRRAFVRHAATIGDDLQFTTIGSVSYLMFLMSWIGSYFFTDPRYDSITSALRTDDPEADRVEAAREAFMALAARHIGETGEIFAERLEGLTAFVTDVTAPDVSLRGLHDKLCSDWGLLAKDSTYDIEFVEAQALKMAVRLQADTPLGQKTCLILSVLLGVRAEIDPLFPWIRDTAKSASDAGSGPDEALFAYAQKRIGAVLRSR